MKALICLLLFLGLSLYAQKTVHNPRPTTQMAPIVLFTPDLSFGADEDADEYIWPDVLTQVLPKKNGDMYVIDNRGKRVLAFDSEGNFLKVAVPQGEGPAELKSILSASLCEDGRLMIMEGVVGSRVHLKVFDSNLELIASPPSNIKYFYQTIDASPDGTHFAATYFGYRQNANKDRMLQVNVSLFNTDSLEEVMPLSVTERISPDFAKRREPGFWVALLSKEFKIRYSGVGVHAFDEQGRLYTAISDTYKITRWSQDLKTAQRIITRDYKPIINSEEHLEGLIDAFTDIYASHPSIGKLVNKKVITESFEKSGLPPGKMPVMGLITMPHDRLMVIHDTNLKTRQNVADLYDDQGRFMGQATFDDFALIGVERLPKMIFKNGFAYTITTDEDGDNRVVRFRYTFHSGS